MRQLNFAEAQPASISGRVTVVRNGFDCDDPNSVEEPLANVTVELRDDKNLVVATTRTMPTATIASITCVLATIRWREITPDGYLKAMRNVGTIIQSHRRPVRQW